MRVAPGFQPEAASAVFSSEDPQCVPRATNRRVVDGNGLRRGSTTGVSATKNSMVPVPPNQICEEVFVAIYVRVAAWDNMVLRRATARHPGASPQ